MPAIPPTVPDPFDLLGIAPQFGLDAGSLERAYLARAEAVQREVAAGDPDAPARAALLNDARATLADPERRASALLQRLGGPGAEKEKSLPPEFLAEMMEVRESVEAAVGSGDPVRLEHWRSWARQRRREFIGAAAQAFDGLAQPPGDSALRDLRRLLNAWRYIERLIEHVEA